jgi:adenylate cyclase
MSALVLDSIRACLEGFIPSVIATLDEQGVPNVSLISQVHYVDSGRVALSYQFFNKTRRNVIATRTASVAVFDPVTMAQYRILLDYEETLTSGPVFESMKAKLAGIASHTGMQGVFRLIGSDIYRVRTIETISVEMPQLRPAARNLLADTRRTCAEISHCKDLGELCDETLACMHDRLGIRHAMILMLDPTESRLYTVASRGYPLSGVGSEVTIGEGVIGAAARERVPIRIGHMSSEYAYGAAIRERSQLAGMSWSAATEIPFPGLKEPQSQIAVPILHADRTLGILFAESPQPLRFGYDDEDALAIVADHFGALAALLHEDEPGVEGAPALAPLDRGQHRLSVRHYKADNSIFLGHDYLIKGVAGAIFWKIVQEHVRAGRVEFSNRELRLDPALRLPAYSENLEARLILLQRRLAERSNDIRIEKCGRGRFRLVVACELGLEEVAENARSADT